MWHSTESRPCLKGARLRSRRAATRMRWSPRSRIKARALPRMCRTRSSSFTSLPSGTATASAWRRLTRSCSGITDRWNLNRQKARERSSAFAFPSLAQACPRSAPPVLTLKRRCQSLLDFSCDTPRRKIRTAEPHDTDIEDDSGRNPSRLPSERSEHGFSEQADHCAPNARRPGRRLSAGAAPTTFAHSHAAHARHFASTQARSQTSPSQENDYAKLLGGRTCAKLRGKFRRLAALPAPQESCPQRRIGRTGGPAYPRRECRTGLVRALHRRATQGGYRGKPEEARGTSAQCQPAGDGEPDQAVHGTIKESCRRGRRRPRPQSRAEGSFTFR